MDSNTITGSILNMKTAQTQQALSISLIKQVANQQRQMANLLEQNTAKMPKTLAQNDGSTFSIFA